ncbi:Potassium transport protein 1 [Elsinoe australis]|uniref:Potassium transport protein 1 n=1 Tax=Elsinoe australis TaxID=40998 RepID=A0A2P7ZQ22_9PEZI|nr:Potassium transport protein 1 [Elsinoe australis]
MLKLNFYRLHLAYFVSVILLSSVIFYGSTTNGNSGDAEADFRLHYIDALFLCTSAMTNTGLNTINLGSITAFQQVMLFFLITMGNVIPVSASTVYIRKYWFRKKMSHLVNRSKAARDVVGDIEDSESQRKDTLPASRVPRDHPSTQAGLRQRKPDTARQARSYYEEHNMRGHGGIPMPWDSTAFMNAVRMPFKSLHRSPHDERHHYLSFHPALDRKGRFHSLAEEQREELGGVEYRALHLLGWLLPAYYIFWVALGIVILVPYSYYPAISNTVRNGQAGNLNPGWWAAFVINSGFCNCGLNLLDSNMTSFKNYYLVLIVAGAMIVVGNQLFPVLLRLIIWVMYKIAPATTELHHTLAFLLHHPRRCFILLFPSSTTWYLLGAQAGIGAILWAFFGILNIGIPDVDPIPAGNQTIMGLFQSTGVRVGGFYVILLSYIAPALQILYAFAMYISAFPIILSLRQSNVYEERSIGVKNDSDDDNKSKSYLGTFIRKQLAYDLWGLALAVWLISIIERGSILYRGDYFTIWSIIFEIISAYGTVGLSLGVPFDNFSFCGDWHTGSKLILILIMLRGRHRGLPYAIDRAVLLPGEELMERMDKEVNMTGRGSTYQAEEKEVRKEERGGQAERDDGSGKAQDPQQDDRKKETEAPKNNE